MNPGHCTFDEYRKMDKAVWKLADQTKIVLIFEENLLIVYFSPEFSQDETQKITPDGINITGL